MAKVKSAKKVSDLSTDQLPVAGLLSLPLGNYRILPDRIEHRFQDENGTRIVNKYHVPQNALSTRPKPKFQKPQNGNQHSQDTDDELDALEDRTDQLETIAETIEFEAVACRLEKEALKAFTNSTDPNVVRRRKVLKQRRSNLHQARMQYTADSKKLKADIAKTKKKVDNTSKQNQKREKKRQQRKNNQSSDIQGMDQSVFEAYTIDCPQLAARAQLRWDNTPKLDYDDPLPLIADKRSVKNYLNQGASLEEPINPGFVEYNIDCPQPAARAALKWEGSSEGQDYSSATFTQGLQNSKEFASTAYETFRKFDWSSSSYKYDSRDTGGHEKIKSESEPALSLVNIPATTQELQSTFSIPVTAAENKITKLFQSTSNGTEPGFQAHELFQFKYTGVTETTSRCKGLSASRWNQYRDNNNKDEENDLVKPPPKPDSVSLLKSLPAFNQFLEPKTPGQADSPGYLPPKLSAFNRYVPKKLPVFQSANLWLPSNFYSPANTPKTPGDNDSVWSSPIRPSSRIDMRQLPLSSPPLMHAESPQDAKTRKRNDDQESGSPKRIRLTEDSFGGRIDSTPIKPEITLTESCEARGSRGNNFIMKEQEKQSMNDSPWKLSFAKEELKPLKEGEIDEKRGPLNVVDLHSN